MAHRLLRNNQLNQTGNLKNGDYWDKKAIMERLKAKDGEYNYSPSPFPDFDNATPLNGFPKIFVKECGYGLVSWG
ncbi:hypothetical protein FACS189414_0760 [Bacteroidia bacterium]|nr:hypothetical protein FACS189414_0760 [Bacteroidia bacterium]